MPQPRRKTPKREPPETPPEKGEEEAGVKNQLTAPLDNEVPAEPKPNTLEPFKLICNLVVAIKNPDGKIIGEIGGSPNPDSMRFGFTFYEPDFDKVRQLVNENWPSIEAQLMGLTMPQPPAEPSEEA